MTRILVAALVTMMGGTAAVACEAVVPDHVRILDCQLTVAVAHAARRSTTLKDLPERVQRTNGLVYSMPPPRSDGPRLHLFLSGKARMAVNDSINGAVRRLARPACQQLFTDFRDSRGRVLADTLTAWGKSPSDALTTLYFVDGDNSRQCRNEATTLYTAPRSRVIYVCGARFAESFALKTTGGEILLIHELLHALGLGENPPSSAQITDAVYARCGK